MLKAYGHTRVHVLDGGFTKWKTEGKAVETDSVENWDKEFDYDLDDSHIVGYEEVTSIIEHGSMQLIENRPPPAVEKTGTYPNAVQIPGPAFLNEDGTTKSAEDITAMFESKGVDINKPMAFSCGGGIMATIALACANKAKIPAEMFIYDGSWSEYSAK